MIPSYPSTPHWPASLSVHRLDRYHGRPEFFLGRDVVITEKLDGGSATICKSEVYARSSFAPTHQPWFSYMKGRTLPKFFALPPQLCPIGEDLYGVHTIEYDPLPDSFFLYHVLDRAQYEENHLVPNTDGDVFWSWDAVEDFARQYNVLTVPVLYRGRFEKIEQITDFFMDNVGKPSIYGPIREGFVIRDANCFPFGDFETRVAKFVRANHVQTDEHWTRNWKPARMLKWTP